MAEALTREQQINEVLQFRPAVRLMYYYLSPDGQVWTLLAKHKRNQLLTLPGGRLDKSDFPHYHKFKHALWDSTLFREALEELSEDDMGILSHMMEGDYRYLGCCIWKHPTTGQPCVDFVSTIELKEMSVMTPNLDDELESLVWLSTQEKDTASPYPNIQLAMELLHRTIANCEGWFDDRTYYDPAQFEPEEVEAFILRFNQLWETDLLPES